MEIQGTQNSSNNFEKEKQFGVLTLSKFKTYYKAIILRQCGIGMRTDIQNNGIELNKIV